MAAVTVIAAALMTALPRIVRQAQATERTAQVRLCRVEEGRVEQVTAVMGVVRYDTERAAVSPATGLVEAVYVSPGDWVRAGQPLFRLGSKAQELAVSAAVSRQAESAALPASAYEGPWAGVGQAAAWETETALSEALLALSALTVRAASDGLVQQVLVTEEGGVAAGAVAVALSGERQQIQCQAVLRDAEQLAPGMRARILHDGGTLCMARVESIGEAVAENGQTVCRVNLTPEERITLPLGAQVEAEIIRCSRENVPVLPVAAISRGDTVRWVADGRCYTVPVTVLLADDETCWVDLPVGTQVVLEGVETVEGQRVREDGQ